MISRITPPPFPFGNSGDVELALYGGNLASWPWEGSMITVGGVAASLISRVWLCSISPTALLRVGEVGSMVSAREEAALGLGISNCRTAHIKGILSCTLDSVHSSMFSDPNAIRDSLSSNRV